MGILNIQLRNPLTYKKHKQSVLCWACDGIDVESEYFEMKSQCLLTGKDELLRKHAMDSGIWVEILEASMLLSMMTPLIHICA